MTLLQLRALLRTVETFGAKSGIRVKQRIAAHELANEIRARISFLEAGPDEVFLPVDEPVSHGRKARRALGVE